MLILELYIFFFGSCPFSMQALVSLRKFLFQLLEVTFALYYISLFFWHPFTEYVFIHVLALSSVHVTSLSVVICKINLNLLSSDHLLSVSVVIIKILLTHFPKYINQPFFPFSSTFLKKFYTFSPWYSKNLCSSILSVCENIEQLSLSYNRLYITQNFITLRF